MRPSQVKALLVTTAVTSLLRLRQDPFWIFPSAAAADTTRTNLPPPQASSSSSPWTEDGACASNDGTCSAAGGVVEGYDPLQYDGPDAEVWHDERPSTCDDDEFWELEWKTLQVLNSHYQHVEFCQDPRNDDMCLDVDNIIQICASYRPHYHEMMVHYTAKFLESVKRVALLARPWAA